jgi:hypothetical protein
MNLDVVVQTTSYLTNRQQQINTFLLTAQRYLAFVYILEKEKEVDRH